MGGKDPKLTGKVMGEIMKGYKGKFDPGAVKRIVEEEMK
jgi:Asp-tRNA(Asn)/Glu-tRNA(Gln) amidotransferase B subunit